MGGIKNIFRPWEWWHSFSHRSSCGLKIRYCLDFSHACLSINILPIIPAWYSQWTPILFNKKNIIVWPYIFFKSKSFEKRKFELSLDKIYTTVYNQTYLELSIRNRSSSSFLKPHEIFIYGPYIYLFSHVSRSIDLPSYGLSHSRSSKHITWSVSSFFTKA